MVCVEIETYRSAIASSGCATDAIGGFIKMRIHEGLFAYDIEQPRDPLTQLPLNWKFTVYRMRPMELVVTTGEAETFAGAEKKAKRSIARLNAEEAHFAA
jgi:hypothetical protein